MRTILQDLRYGARMLLKKPGFTSIAVLTLALGIGMNVALFSVINAVILRSLPYQQADRLVQLWGHDRRTGVTEVPVSNADFLAWRAQARNFASLAAHNNHPVTLLTNDGATGIAGVFVASNFFATLGATPQLGRIFTPEEETPNQSRAVIVSHQFWQSRLSGRADVIGQTITLDEGPHTIVGVLRSDYRHPEVFSDRAPEIFLPLPLRANDHRHALRVIGRLQPGVTSEQAQAEMTTIARQLERAFPESNTDWGAYVVPLAEQHSSKVRRVLFLLQGAVGFVLLITCVNLANLLLARLTAREKELAIRAALGAGKLRIIRLILCESFWLAVFGGLAGLLLAAVLMDSMPTFAPRELTNLGKIGIDGQVLGFTILLSLFTIFIFGLVPVWQVSRTNLNEVLKETLSAPRGTLLRSLLVVAEIALTLVLLTGAGLMLRSLLHLHNVPLGFDAEKLLLIRISLLRSVPDQQVGSIYQQMTAQIELLPGVQSAAMTSSVPLSGTFNNRTGVMIEGQPMPASNKIPDIGMRFISPNYFRTMSIPLVAGRYFTDADSSTSSQVAIVNEAFARQYLSGLAPLDQKLLLGATPNEIVGIVRDFKYESLQTEAEPEIYTPIKEGPGWKTTALVVRTRIQPESLRADVQRAVRQVEGNALIERVETMKDLLSDATARPRFILLLLSAFALVALLLTGVGVYGVLAYTVAQNTREIGIRMALGADRHVVLKLVLGQGMKLALLGVLIGLGGAFALTRLLKTLLFGVSPTDPLTLALIAALLMLVALLACWIPARRAAKVDPMIALRSE
jgi:putative ABC transport system permease protein